jgi:phage tail sheath gpL-like
LADIVDSTSLITVGNVTVTAPVSEAGVITELILGDDYLAANGRALTWSVTEISGMSLANATAVFGMRQKDVNVTITGAVSDGAGATWDVTIEIANDDWGALAEGLASYSLEIKDSSNNREITRVINELGGEVLLRRKST